ncbi:sugar O-acetyltransferase [Spirosoma sp. BT702]|uniref:Acetyltransferase n=1 Tax=Spirosoma profusum TaxID=2771354 RepID=A0A927ASY4_9BACT|nr:sugar O-acetyltransferase [Spirosoma profusum]MBD2704608.1 sugar O-acetyltransferase [Spirosoma profusum]
MSELEKMLAGEWYWSYHPDLMAMRARARELFTQYNQTLNAEKEIRNTILTTLLGSFGKDLDIQPPFYCDYGTYIYLADNVFINFNCTILDYAPIRIGNNALIGPNVSLYAASHPLSASHRISKGSDIAKPITIGDNVWLAGNVVVCPGVTIGDNTTIGAGSIVTRDIPSNVFAAGNPCRVIRSVAD